MLNHSGDTMTAYEVHPAAEIFPRYSTEKLQTLAASIVREGQLSPIEILPDGRLLDGRNRLAACELAGVEPVTVTVDPDSPTTYVVARNLDGHRDMTNAQKDALGVTLVAMFAVEAKERQGARNDLSEHSAISGRMLEAPRPWANEQAAEVVGRGKSVITAQKKLRDLAARKTEWDEWREAAPPAGVDSPEYDAAMPTRPETVDAEREAARAIVAKIDSGEIATTGAAVKEFNRFTTGQDARAEAATKRAEASAQRDTVPWQASSLNKGSVASDIEEATQALQSALDTILELPVRLDMANIGDKVHAAKTVLASIEATL